MYEKRCTKCNLKKLIIEFYKNSRTKDGHSSWCKECMKQNAKEIYDRRDKYGKHDHK